MVDCVIYAVVECEIRPYIQDYFETLYIQVHTLAISHCRATLPNNINNVEKIVPMVFDASTSLLILLAELPKQLGNFASSAYASVYLLGRFVKSKQRHITIQFVRIIFACFTWLDNPPH